MLSRASTPHQSTNATSMKHAHDSSNCHHLRGVECLPKANSCTLPSSFQPHLLLLPVQAQFMPIILLGSSLQPTSCFPPHHLSTPSLFRIHTFLPQLISHLLHL